MKKQSPTGIAKNPDSTPEQLKNVYVSTRDRLNLYRRINRLLASNPNTPIDLLEEFAVEEDTVTRKNALSNPNLPKDTLAHLLLELDEHNVLIGNYPKNFDLSRCNHKDPIRQVYSEDDYQWDKEPGRYPMPDIHLCGSDTVEEICLPAGIWYGYAIVENLPHLKKLRIGDACKKHPGNYGTPQWLVCRNLPELKEIVVGGGVSWLRLEDMKELSVVDVSNCPQLDYFYISNCSAIKKIDINNCVKLRNIEGLDKDIQDGLDVTGHIKALQKRSRSDGSLYWPMTFADVDKVLSNINHATVLAIRKGLCSDLIDPTRENVNLMNNTDSYGFGFRLLRPHEAVDAGGTGASFAYETILPFYKNGRLLTGGIGNAGQEACLEYILDHISQHGIDIPGRRSQRFDDYPTTEEVLAFLNQLLDEEHKSQPPLKNQD